MSIRKTFAWLAFPVSIGYAMAMIVRNFLFELGILRQAIPPVTTIGVGNIAAGGTGKTPLSDYLLGLFADDYCTAIVSRGYKRKSSGCIIHQPEPMSTNGAPVQETPDGSPDMLSTFGDEVSMLINKHPQVLAAVCKDRNEAINNLLETETPPQLIILDDVYQHRYVKPTINILLTEYSRLYADDLILPFGNLREPRSASRRANIIIVSKSPKKLNSLEKHIISDRLKVQSYQKVFFSYLEYNDLQPLNEKAKTVALDNVDSVLAFCGIANPNPFVEELKKHYKTVDFLQFADHHAYTKEDLTNLLKRFEGIESEKKIIVTTEKDAARLTNSPYLCQFESAPLYDLPVSVRFHEEEKFNETILNYVRQNNHHC